MNRQPPGTAPCRVRPLGRSACGAEDLVGNVWEWVACGEPGLALGGGWRTSGLTRCGDARVRLRPGAREPDLGFRVWFDPT